MNLNFLIKKKHIFKNRVLKPYKSEINIKRRKGIYTINQMRFEFVYLRVIKKLFRKKYLKKKSKAKKIRYWLMVKPNFLLTMKSKNSRMGSGVGSYVRVCSLIKPNTPIILLRLYSLQFLRNIIKYLKLKINIDFYLNLYRRKQV